MQARFSQRQRKRVFRLIANPRFRAAFDFLELRLVASNAHADDVAFWRDAQLHPAEAVAQQEALDDGEADDAAPRKRRRRRRKPVDAAS